MLTEAAKKRGIEVRYQARALDLLYNGSASRACGYAATSR